MMPVAFPGVDRGSLEVGDFNFYVRRGLRLLPALYVLLAVVVVIAITTDLLPTKLTIAEAFSAAFYIYPIILLAKANQVFLFHLWTLSTEEWFYFAWPAFLLFVGLRPGTTKRFRVVIWTLGAICVKTIERNAGQTAKPASKKDRRWRT